MTNIYNSFLSLEDMRIKLRFLFEWYRGADWWVEYIQNPCTTVWLITGGERELHLNDQTYRIKEGDLIVIAPYSRISMHVLEDRAEPFQYLSLGCEWKMGGFDFVDLYQFPVITALGKEQLLGLSRVWRTLHRSWSAFVEAVTFGQVEAPSIYRKGTLPPSRIEIASDQAGEFFEIKGYLYQWAAKVFQLLQSRLPSGPKRMDPRVQKVCNYISNHYSEKVSLKHLSDIVFLSESQLRVLFKKTLHVSPMNYMYQVRLQKAKEMLVVTDEPIGIIASAVGFEELSYFCRMFRKREQVSPAEFRRTKSDFHV